MSKRKAPPSRLPGPGSCGPWDAIGASSEQPDDVADALRRAVDITVGPNASFAEREAAYLEVLAKACRLAAEGVGE